MKLSTLAATKTPKQKLAHVAEECAEFLKAYAKYQRFGMWPYFEGKQYDNFDDMQSEMTDLQLAMDRWHAYASTTSNKQRQIDFANT